MNVAMVSTPELDIRVVTNRIFTTGRITREDERALHQMMRSNVALDSDAVSRIRRVLERLQMGLLKLAD